jgi:hypothetical protein
MGDGCPGRPHEHRRHDDRVDHQAHDGSDDRLDDAVQCIAGSLGADREHEHRADGDLVGQAGGEPERPGDEQREHDDAEHHPARAAEEQAGAIGEEHPGDDPDAAFDALGERLVDARLHDEQGGDGREDGEGLIEQEVADDPRHDGRDRGLQHL